MKNGFIALIVILSGCVSSGKRSERNFQEVRNLPFGSAESLERQWGPPASKDPWVIAGKSVILWEYKSPDGSSSADFAIDPTTRSLVEKTYYPRAQSIDDLQKEFSGIAFEKLHLRCRHFGETALVNKEHGILITYVEKEPFPVACVSFETPEVLALRLQENATRKCRP